MGVKPVRMVALIDAQVQAADDAAKWNRAKGAKLPDSAVAAYRAGHLQGWRDCVRFLKLHGHLEAIDKVKVAD